MAAAGIKRLYSGSRKRAEQQKAGRAFARPAFLTDA
jgi:hypothetical protein